MCSGIFRIFILNHGNLCIKNTDECTADAACGLLYIIPKNIIRTWNAFFFAKVFFGPSYSKADFHPQNPLPPAAPTF